MFIITTSKDKTINWPVKVEVAADGGKINKFEFTGVFKRLDDDEREAIAEAAKLAAPSQDDTDPEVNNAWKERAVDNILKSMTDWKGVCDESKSPIDFNRDTLLAAARSIDGLPILRAISTALGEIASGSRAKN